MKRGFLAIFFVLLLASSGNVLAQETPQSGSRTIIVQTDTEEAIPNHQIICKQIPKKLDYVAEDEIQLIEMTTSSSGEAQLASQTDNVIYTCMSKDATTQDYCWYFPTTTQFFEVSRTAELNDPIYLVAQQSDETCNKTFTQTELEAGIDQFLPAGTPPPFNNKNIAGTPTTPTPELGTQTTQETASPETISFWNWILKILGSIF